MRHRNLTPVQILTSNSSSGNGVFTPTTGPLASGSWEAVRARWAVNSGTMAEVKPGLQYSDDGATWDSPVALAGSWSRPDYPSFGTLGYTALPPDGATERRFVRFGFFSRRYLMGEVPLMVSVIPEFTQSGRPTTRMIVPPISAASKNSTSDAMFLPGTDPVVIGDWSQIRAAMEVLAQNGAAAATLGYWLSDDGFNWGTYATSDPYAWQAGVAKAVPGMSFENTQGTYYYPWTTVVGAGQPIGRPKMLVQFGALVKDSSSVGHPCYVRIGGMVEMR